MQISKITTNFTNKQNFGMPFDPESKRTLSAYFADKMLQDSYYNPHPTMRSFNYLDKNFPNYQFSLTQNNNRYTLSAHSQNLCDRCAKPETKVWKQGVFINPDVETLFEKAEIFFSKQAANTERPDPREKTKVRKSSFLLTKIKL